jgi:hypothetical protein
VVHSFVVPKTDGLKLVECEIDRVEEPIGHPGWFEIGIDWRDAHAALFFWSGHC